MKIHCVEVSGGEWDDHYCYYESFYISEKKAEERKEELENKLARLIKLEEIASNCDKDNATDEQCEKCMACNNTFYKVHENEKYVVKEIDVID